MKKILITIIAALCIFASPVSSLEWGGVFKNDTEVLTSDFKSYPIMQSNGIYLWISNPLNDTATYYLTAEAMYKYKLSIVDKEVTFSNIADLDLLKFVGTSGAFSIDAGRFLIMDNSGAVFSQNSDGVSLKYSFQTVRLSAYAGCTGLINSNAVSMLNAEGEKFVPNNDVYALSNPFIPLSVSVDFPAVFGNQTISIQGNGFIDLGEEKASRYYGTLSLSGPISNSFFYNITSVAGTNSFKNFMNFSSINMYVFPTSKFMINAGAEYASGDSGKLSKFVGITSRTAYNSIAYPETSGVFIPKLAISVSTNVLYAGITGKYVMDCSENKFANKGAEGDLNLAFNIFSDFQIGCDVTAYFGTAGDNSENNYTATLRAAVSF